MDSRAERDLAAVGFFLAGDHAKQRGLAGAVRADDADDRAGRNLDAEIVDQQALAVALRHVLELDHAVAQAFGDRDEDLLRLVALLLLVRAQLIEARDTRLALGLTRLRVGAHPLELLLHGLDARGLLLGLDLQALLLLLQPRAVVALPRDAVAAIELENPLRRVVEKVAIVGNGDHGAGKFLQELLEPVDALGIEVVGRFVQQQHVGLRQQQAAQRHPALLAAGEVGDLRVPRGQAQRIGSDLELMLHVAAAGGEDRFVLGLVGGELIEVGVGLGVGGVDLLQLFPGFEDLAQPFLHRLPNRLLRVELRFLRQETDAHIGHRDRLALDVLVLTRHDLEQAGLAGAVQPQHADLGAGEKRQRNILEDDALGGHHLAHPVHGVDVLRHRFYRFGS